MPVCVSVEEGNSGGCFSERSHCSLCQQRRHCRTLCGLTNMWKVSVITYIHTLRDFFSFWKLGVDYAVILHIYIWPVFCIVLHRFFFWFFFNERAPTYQKLQSSLHNLTILYCNQTLGFAPFEPKHPVFAKISLALTIRCSVTKLCSR